MTSAASAQEAMVVANGDPQSVHVEVFGRVAPHCGFVDGRAPGDSGAVDIDLRTVAQIRFAIDCNVPFDIRVSARDGGLRNTRGAALSPAAYGAGYRDLISYDARLLLERDAGGPLAVECTSQTMAPGGACEMTTGRGVHSEFSARSKPAVLTIVPDGVDPSRLVAGGYGDVVTIEVSP